MKKIILPCLVLIFASCTQYNPNFECHAPGGYGCNSVSEIESMIVERKDACDVFCPDQTSENSFYDLLECERKKSLLIGDNPSIESGREGIIYKKPESVKRVWFVGKETETGNFEEGHYLYFTLKDDQWIVKK